MRILLVMPPWIASRNRDFCVFFFPPHSGLAYIAGCLKRMGHEVKVLDAQAERLSFREFGKRVKALDPELVGITTYTDQIEEAKEAARIIKEDNPKIPIIVGGNHVSALLRETLEEFHHFDVAVQGEGEMCMEELVDWRSGRRRLEDIAGIAYRSDGRILVNPPRPDMEDLDSLPFPAYELFPLEKYPSYRSRWNKLRSLPLSTSRGCPYSCIFCCKVMGSKIRCQSPEVVMQNIKYLADRFGVGRIGFNDDNFTINRDRVNQICEGIQRSGWQRRLKFICQTRVDLVDRDLLKSLGSSGFEVIFFGIESGVEKTLKHAEKKINLEQARNAVNWAREAGIKTKTSFILGFPKEDIADLKATVDFAVKLNPDFCAFTIMTPGPGTRLMEMAKNGEGGARLISRRWSDYRKHNYPVYETQKISRPTLEKWQLWAYLRFYFSFRKIWNVSRYIRFRLIAYYLYYQFKVLLSPARGKPGGGGNGSPILPRENGSLR